MAADCRANSCSKTTLNFDFFALSERLLNSLISAALNILQVVQHIKGNKQDKQYERRIHVEHLQRRRSGVGVGLVFFLKTHPIFKLLA